MLCTNAMYLNIEGCFLQRKTTFTSGIFNREVVFGKGCLIFPCFYTAVPRIVFLLAALQMLFNPGGWGRWANGFKGMKYISDGVRACELHYFLTLLAYILFCILDRQGDYRNASFQHI